MEIQIFRQLLLDRIDLTADIFADIYRIDTIIKLADQKNTAFSVLLIMLITGVFHIDICHIL